MPTLIALESLSGDLHGVMGVRGAGEEPLLLEHYLDHPIEQEISARTQREQIMELGNLAAASAGASRVLILALNAYLQSAGYRWVTFTAVLVLKNVFRRLKLNLIDLGPADGSRLGNARENWGNYYQHAPSVVAGDVDHGFRRLEALMRQEQIQHVVGSLLQQAMRQGRHRMEVWK